MVVSSRDHREYDEDIERRDYQIAVVVFEKMQALLVSRPQLMEVVGLVVDDELQLITDEVRGPTLELLLTKLRIGHRGAIRAVAVTPDGKRAVSGSDGTTLKLWDLAIARNTSVPRWRDPMKD